jgi:hypothetical protein
MSSISELHAAYRDWRRLAEAKGEAIRSGNWPLVADCQKAVEELQPLVLRLSRETQDEWSKEEKGRHSGEATLRGMIGEIFQIESRNKDLLRNAQQEAGARLLQLQRDGRLLHQVQRLYAPSLPAAWTSFS